MSRINMHYCVFRNTLQSLREAYEDMADMDMTELSDEERSAFEQLVTLCNDIADDYGEDDE